MTIQTRKRGTITILDLDGHLTAGRPCEELRSRFREALDAGERFFVFDFAKVPYLDSTGVGECIACYKRARERDARIALVLKGKAHELFVFMELTRIFEIFDDAEAALASFAG